MVLSKKGDKLPGNKALKELGKNRKIGDGSIGGRVREARSLYFLRTGVINASLKQIGTMPTPRERLKR